MKRETIEHERGETLSVGVGRAERVGSNGVGHQRADTAGDGGGVGDRGWPSGCAAEEK